MLTEYGVPFLIWMDEKAIPKAYDALDWFADYTGRWRKLLGV